MNFDRNTVLGFVFLGLLFIGFFWYTNKEAEAHRQFKEKQLAEQRARQPKVDPAVARLDSMRADSLRKAVAAGALITYTQGQEQLQIVENEVIRIAFSNKGGQPRWVELKAFGGPDSGRVRLAGAAQDGIDYKVATGTNQAASINSFYFTPSAITRNADGSQQISYQVQTPQGQITHQYLVKNSDYMVDFNLDVPAALTPGNTLTLNWQNTALQQQKDLEYERQQSFLTFREDGDYDDEGILGDGPETFEKPLNWVGVKQQFFNSTLIAKKNFASGTLEWSRPADSKTIVQARANLKLVTGSGALPMALYYGPNDYQLLKSYGYDMESMVNLGSGIFAFVKYLNRWVIIPVFDFFRNNVTANMGIVILLLTLVIRLLISPLTYKSYLSGAKMKALRPEIDKLKEKHGTDQQAISMGQMQLFREAGVNPLGGCMPALLQIPIFFALYNFFNSSIALRGKAFLWAEDLSQYDTIVRFGVDIPLLGNHLSLFTILAVVTSLLISLYSMSMTPTQDNPMMKYMPYIFPVIMLFIFNKLPSALTWYYTVSNIITLLLQFVIQNYIINHDKILAQIEENRKKPKTKSKWQERMEQMQEQQKRMQETQNKKRNG